MKQFPFLDKALERLKPFLSDERVSEISVNRPGELFVERLGVAGMERVVDQQFSVEWIRTLSERVAGSTNQVVNDEHPILSASLPTGERFQCVLQTRASRLQRQVRVAAQPAARPRRWPGPGASCR